MNNYVKAAFEMSAAFLFLKYINNLLIKFRNSLNKLPIFITIVFPLSSIIEIVKNHTKRRRQMERKQHYKLYKSGKLWMTALISAGVLWGSQQAIHADTTVNNENNVGGG
ncbi:KxYKxGKxW signal peptide domain-containing protein [Limosilactobacillus sp. STM2_1]|uniref:KxYKxGKxW signal peptide domain-containing protein n=2 Tax=Limosilactobacillus rudii TaxID=2759755 RepID=A0A7W3UKN2_9LACO|nr:KxYKxGKxW signal peptide domain-containing protein [Limosilactobacillus rudii]MBB1097361.1 KxYKxGKxW signal peptide domain-containing protein [Limosilactobacillus rudii]